MNKNNDNNTKIITVFINCKDIMHLNGYMYN